MLKNNAQRELLKSIHKDFVEEIIEKSKNISVEQINPASLREGFRYLEREGFSYKESAIVTCKTEYQEVHDIPVYEYDIIPEETAIIIHPESVVPSPPEMVKPAIIIHPEAIVTLKE